MLEIDIFLNKTIIKRWCVFIWHTKKMSKKQQTKLKNEDTLSKLTRRFDDMRSERANFEQEWDVCDAQFAAEVIEDNDGKLLINDTMEQDLIEQYVGRTAGDIIYDVKPDPYNANIEQVESAKYILDNFLDRENFYKEHRYFRIDKAKYGTGIYYTGLRLEIDEVPEYKEGTKLEAGEALWTDKDMINKEREQYYMTPINVPIRMFYIDDKAIYQPDFEKAEDCFMLEVLSKKEIEQRYWDNKYFNQENIEALQPVQENSAEYGIDNVYGNCVLYHYYNRITKEYCIMGNKEFLLFEWKMLYKHGQLPFVVAQHYPDNNFIYGIGICRKVRVQKWYKINMMQSLMDGARLSSGKILAMWAGTEPVDWDLFVNPWEISIAKFTNSVEQLTPVDTRVDLNSLSGAIQIIDDEIRKSTGIDNRAPFEAPAQTLGQTEIIEENKAIRSKAIDEANNQALDQALTMTLQNISQFAPVLMRRITEIKNEKWQIIEKISEFPKIQIENVKITKKKWQTVIEEDYGNYWYLELKPDTLEGDLTVRVITPSTYNSVLVSVEKNRFTELVNNLVALGNLYWPEAIQEIAPFKEIRDKAKIVYGYWQEYTATTKLQQTREENIETVNELQQSLQAIRQSLIPNQWWNVNIQNQNTQVAWRTEWEVEWADQTTEVATETIQETGTAI